MWRLLSIPVSCLIFSTSAAGQESPDPSVLRVDTELVIRTVLVRDSDGHPVEGLTAADFLVTEDGLPQTITVFEFQRIDDTPLPAIAAAPRPALMDDHPAVESGGTDILTGPPGEVRYRDRRLLAFYFDMVGLDPPERRRSLEAAREFIETQMSRADLVAILTYSAGSARLVQDFTDDRARLLDTMYALETRTEDASARQTGGAFDVFATDRRLMGLETAVTMLGGLSEQKSLIYFSGGVSLDLGNQAQLRATLNASARANVSIFPIDARGLSAFAPLGNANESPTAGTALHTVATAMSRLNTFQRSQDALYTLAADTGGRAFLDSNDLARGIVQAQLATSGYYIVGYYPADTTPDGRLRHVKIRLHGRSEFLTYRDSYHADKDFSHYTAADKERQLEDALQLDDPITEVHIAVEADYFRMSERDYFVAVAVRIPGDELARARDMGTERTRIDFIGEVRDESGRRITHVRDRMEVRIGDVGEEIAASRTVQYDTGFTLPPGRYTLKVLARNTDTGRIGTYQSTLVIPDLDESGSGLPISSVVLGSQRAGLSEVLFSADRHEISGTPAANPLVEDGRKLIPSVGRVFSSAQPLYVYLEAYIGEATLTGPLVAFATLYREGERVFETPVFRLTDTVRTNPTTVPVRLTIPLDRLPSGEYTCQVSLLYPAEHRMAFWRTPVLIVP